MARPSLWSILRSALPGLVISIGATIWCWHATGPTLGLYLGTILVMTLYTPALVLVEECRNRWIAVAGIVVGVATVLGISTAFADVTLYEWFRCSLLLAAYVFALGGVAGALSAARFPAPIAAGITVLLGFAWLTWPVWLSPWMTQRVADWLTPANPLLALNGVVIHLGTWDRAPIAYRALTVLNQDVPYHLPASIIPAVILQLFIGTPGMMLNAITKTTEHPAPPTPGQSGARGGAML